MWWVGRDHCRIQSPDGRQLCSLVFQKWSIGALVKCFYTARLVRWPLCVCFQRLHFLGHLFQHGAHTDIQNVFLWKRQFHVHRSDTELVGLKIVHFGNRGGVLHKGGDSRFLSPTEHQSPKFGLCQAFLRGDHLQKLREIFSHCGLGQNHEDVAQIESKLYSSMGLPVSECVHSQCDCRIEMPSWFQGRRPA